ncbi:unnamed protein product [Protopolystoma xenopodis]|uniref:Uncharacterized protein n=1 Tax=Protopolystoma xenopodis TaxID=117903 RepID=A0A448WR32_9PLAT|nr:unnamed protein product [Protopolystoma xenopodis]
MFFVTFLSFWTDCSLMLMLENYRPGPIVPLSRRLDCLIEATRRVGRRLEQMRVIGAVVASSAVQSTTPSGSLGDSPAESVQLIDRIGSPSTLEDLNSSQIKPEEGMFVDDAVSKLSTVFVYRIGGCNLGILDR